MSILETTVPPYSSVVALARIWSIFKFFPFLVFLVFQIKASSIGKRENENRLRKQPQMA